MNVRVKTFKFPIETQPQLMDQALNNFIQNAPNDGVQSIQSFATATDVFYIITLVIP